MATYGVVFNIDQPEHLNRVHVAIRVLAIVVLSVLAANIGWFFGLIYLVIPLLAAVLISQKGSARYLAEAEGNMTKWLRYVVAVYAYFWILTDKLPNEDPGSYLRFEVSPNGTPSAGNALLRIILAIPSALVLALLLLVGLALALVAAIFVLIKESYPAGIFNYLRGVLRWEARLLTYLGSLVGDYPPFALDTGVDPAS